MTYQEVFKQAEFEDIWKYLQTNFGEVDKLKPLYKDLIDIIKELPIKKEYNDEPINFFWSPCLHIGGAPDPQEWLVGREVRRNFPRRIGVKNKLDDPAELAAYLIYWSTLYSFKTQEQQANDFEQWLDDMESDKPFEMKFEDRAVTESHNRKRELFWKSAIDNDYAYSWSANLWILRKKLQYNIGYWRFVQRHVGWEEEVKQMQTCRKLLEIAARDYTDISEIHVNDKNAVLYGVKIKDGEYRLSSLMSLRREKAFRLVWRYIDHYMKNWWD